MGLGLATLGLVAPGLAQAPPPRAAPIDTLAGLPLSTQAQPDTARTRVSRVVRAPRTPRGALWRAAAVPGWGQLYNGQPVKLPFVYAALGGTVGALIYTNRLYVRYRRGYRFALAQDSTSTLVPGPRDEAAANRIPNFDILLERNLEDQIRAQREVFRRNRDLLILGCGLVYGLTVLDAYVSAQLLDFDVSEDLSLSLYPHPQGYQTVIRFRF